jgi:hypothetical protein
MTRSRRSVARHLSVEILSVEISEAGWYGKSPLSGGTFGVPDSDEPLRYNWWGAPETQLAVMMGLRLVVTARWQQKPA